MDSGNPRLVAPTIAESEMHTGTYRMRNPRTAQNYAIAGAGDSRTKTPNMFQPPEKAVANYPAQHTITPECKLIFPPTQHYAGSAHDRGKKPLRTDKPGPGALSARPYPRNKDG